MFVDPFGASRRADISVSMNEAIREALGDEAEAFVAFLERSGVAAIRKYPGLEVSFEIGRMFGDVTPIAGHRYLASPDAGVLVEQALREIAQAAVERLRRFDANAYITVSVIARSVPKRAWAYRGPPDIRSWRGFETPSISTLCRM